MAYFRRCSRNNRIVRVVFEKFVVRRKNVLHNRIMHISGVFGKEVDMGKGNIGFVIILFAKIVTEEENKCRS